MSNSLACALLMPATSTQFKIEEYATIAARHPHDRVAVWPLSHFQSHHSAVEDKPTAQLNAEEKLSSVTRASDTLRIGGENHTTFHQKLRNNDINFLGGIGTAMQRSYVLVDDTTNAIPKVLWDSILPDLARQVVPDCLKAAPCEFPEVPGVPYMSITDIGSIVATVGQGAFWRLVQKAAAAHERYQWDPPVVFHEVCCKVTRLSESVNEPAKEIRAYTPYVLYTPNGLSGEVLVPSEIPIQENFLCLPSDRSRPVSDYYDEFLAKDSTRKKIYQQLVRLIRENEELISNRKVIPLSTAGREMFIRKRGREQKRKVQALTVVQLAHSQELPKMPETDYRLKTRAVLHHLTRDQEAAVSGTFSDLMSMEFCLTGKEGKSAHADGLILGPNNRHDQLASAYNQLMFDSMLIAKGLDARYRYAPSIVIDYKGCWTEAVNTYLHRARVGYNKGYIRHATHDGLAPDQSIVTIPRVKHTSYSHFDHLEGNDLAALYRAADEVINFRFENYNRVAHEKRPLIVGGTPCPPNLFQVVGFISASSDRRVDHENARGMGRLVGEIGGAWIDGGGSQHSFEAGKIGYQETRRPHESHLTCISTHDIVMLETKHGRLPDYSDYWELHPGIGTRLLSFISHDPYVLDGRTPAKPKLYMHMGGGDGTGQEGRMVSLLKLMNHPAVQNSSLIYLGENPATHAEIESIYGAPTLQDMLKNPYALQDQGVYLFPRVTPGLKSLVHDLKDQHDQHVRREYASRPLLHYDVA